MLKKEFHLGRQPIPEGFRIYFDRLSVAGLFARKRHASKFCLGRDQTIRFEREPTNAHDPNAIKVIGSWEGLLWRREKVLGYVPADIAAAIAENGYFDKIRPRLLKTYAGTDQFSEVEFQILGPAADFKALRGGRG